MTTGEHTKKGIMKEDNPTIVQLGMRKKEEHETQHGRKQCKVAPLNHSNPNT